VDKRDWSRDGKRRDVPPSRLLLVDDDPALLLALSGTLQNRLDPCTVDACVSGMQALKFVKAHTYATIISDVMMPDMNGWQFLRAVKQLKVKTPVFLMSGNRDPVVMKNALAAGASGFFAKPFDLDELVATVRHGMEVFRLNRVTALQDSLLRRAQSHHAMLVEKLHQHDGAYAMFATHTPVPERSQPVDQAWQQRIHYRSTVVRHMALLEKFLVRLAALHRRTSARLMVVQDNTHGHAVQRALALQCDDVTEHPEACATLGPDIRPGRS
jgi:CheY-like chemotaxis protein